MPGLDVKRLEGIRLSSRPLLQRVVAYGLLWPSYTLLRRVRVEGELPGGLGPEPVILAANHTDRYNYFPLLYRWWREKGRFTSSWMKGKYYENPLLGAMMASLGTLPAVSRGYILQRDFRAVTKRAPTEDEYRALRLWMEEGPAKAPPPGAIPDAVLATPRDVLGRVFEPSRETYGEAMNDLYTLMMRRFTALHEQSFAKGLDLLIFPQGTRSLRLSRGRPGIGQIALHFRKTILPVGISGSDRVYPGALPLARAGTITLRFGTPLRYEDLREFHVGEPFEPFTREAEAAHREKFQGVADLVMERIDGLLDPEYRFSQTRESDGVSGAKRFLA